MLELVSKELELSFEGKIQKLKYPTVKHMKKINSSLNEAGANEIALLSELLQDLGMDEDVAENLEVEHVNLIVQELTATKK